MITLKHQIGDRPVTVHAFEPGDENTDRLDDLVDMLRHTPVLAVDTETTGLDPYAPDFALRLVQVSDGRTAYVLRGDAHHDLIALAVGGATRIAVHNAEFDLPVLARAMPRVFRLDELYAQAVDVSVQSRLIDPLGAAARRGGRWEPCHRLKDLTRHHLDAGFAADRALSDELRRLKLPARSNGGFAAIPVHNPVYLLYAGLDAIATAQLHDQFAPQITGDLPALLDYENRLAYQLAGMRERGLLVDHAYTDLLLTRMREQWAETFATVAAHGLTTTSLDTAEDKQQFTTVLAGLGVTVGKTQTGQPSLAKPAVLAASEGTPGAELVAAFYRCREIHKFATDYLNKFLTMRDANNRLHPAIHALGAQTGRMSISEPPLQQIPRDADTRGCLIADDGHVLVAADFSQVEFRIAAALSGDENMIQAIRDGVDLHAVTARRLYGTNFTDDERTVAKRAGFGRLYGGGANALALQCGVSSQVASEAIAAFDAEYPGIVAFARNTGSRDTLTTRIGRRLPVDPNRSYAAVNYVVQSEARDLFASALLRLAANGFADYLWLPVHDEIVANVPEQDADDAARVMTQIMAADVDGVPIVAEAKVLGKRWSK